MAAIAAEDQVNVTLLSSVTLSESLNIESNKVIDLNGCTLTTSTTDGKGDDLVVAEGVSLTLKNGTIKTGNTAIFSNGGDVVLEDCTIEATSSGAVAVSGKGGSVTAKNVTVNSTGNGAFRIRENGTMTLTDCNVTSPRTAVRVDDGKVTIEGGAYSNTDNSSNESAYCIAILGGKATINTTVNKDNDGSNGGLSVNNAEVNITGGEYYGNEDIHQYGLHALSGANVTYVSGVEFNSCYIQVKFETKEDKMAASKVNGAEFNTDNVKTGAGFIGTKEELNTKIDEINAK